MLIANAPCSWGVFYPTGNRLTAQDYLAAVAGAGYRGTELGPLGFLPEDPAQLADALAARDLTLVGAAHVHTLAEPGTWVALRDALDRICRILTAQGVRDLAIMDESEWYPAGKPGVVDAAGWSNAMDLIRRAHDHAADAHGVKVTVHPHVGTCIETEAQIDRMLEETPVDLCFDTGHHAFWNQDPVAYMRRRWDRIAYMHLKNVDRAVLERVWSGELDPNASFAQGAMAALPDGSADIPAVVALLVERGFAGPVVVEQDPSDTAPESPDALALRNRLYLEEAIAAVERS